MKVAIVGAGKLGTKISEALLEGDHSVTIIDKNEELLYKLSSQMDVMTVVSNAKQISTLEALEIDSYDYLLTATNSDEKNIVIASFAKKLGCKNVIARVRDPEHMNQIDFIKETMGIDYMVNPDMSITMEIYKYLVEKYTLSNGIFSTGKIALTEFNADKLPYILNKPIKEIYTYISGMLIVVISRNGKVIIPGGNTVIHAHDVLYIIGEKNRVMDFNSKVRDKNKHSHLRNVMIIGGGKTGLYLAQKLSEYGIAAKVIEKNKERCEYLSQMLDDVLIIHGDATDSNLLDEENIDEMDAFVTCTGFDEENLLLALMAKQKSVDDVIAKISRASYATLIESMGIDVALNPLEMTSSHILRYIQGSKRVVSSQLIQGQAEIVEIVAEKNMEFINTPMSKLKPPPGIIFGAVNRGLDVIIPSGSTEIHPGDRVIIVCLLSNIPDLEHMLRSGKRSFFK